jgi:Holliday junction resolvase RusA-like endonuclease
LHREKAPKFDGPLKVVMGFGFERPKSVSEKKRPHHITSPDLDNLIKTVGDAGNGILWEDDKQIVEMKCFKYYSKAPIITITVERVSREIP